MALEDHSAESGRDLVVRISGGDRQAEDELVRRFHRGVTIILSRASRDPSIVDDLRQDTFRIALEKIRDGAVREPEKISGFIASVARNLVIEHFRKASARRISTAPEKAGLVSADPDPLEGMLEAERAAIVRRVLSEMRSQRDRRILFRFYIAEDEKEAICRDLGLSSLHFNRVLFRARERYRELYEAAAKMRLKETR
jgi:RNA polymerase sigma-70 factor (ECF subfamily)